MPVKKSKSTKRRTEVKDLPKKESKLAKEEQKKVKGGRSGAEFDLPGWGKPSSGGRANS
jgi:hypothetical protein